MLVEPVELVVRKAKELAHHSWEYGVVSEALIELYDPHLSVFSEDLAKVRERSSCKDSNVAGLEYAQRFIRLDQQTLADGEGSAGDPASLGVAALLLGQHDSRYMEAAKRQKEYLLEFTPRFSNGAISHRDRIAELWSDSLYMCPPFLAFYGYLNEDEELLKEAARQCLLYRDVLLDRAVGLLSHIAGPENEDLGFWSTGNGWAIAGMVRVLAVVQHANKTSSNESLSELGHEIACIICQIVKSTAKYAGSNDSGHLIRNYINDEMWFPEKAGTAAIVSAIFRLAVLKPGMISEEIIAWATSYCEAIENSIGDDGVIVPVVNPMDWHDPAPCTEGSAEGQAFFLLSFAAYRDWKAVRRDT